MDEEDEAIVVEAPLVVAVVSYLLFASSGYVIGAIKVTGSRRRSSVSLKILFDFLD